MEFTNKNYAVFVDLENAGGKPATIHNIIEKVKIRGDILLSKVYGYGQEYSCLLYTSLFIDMKGEQMQNKRL